MYNGHMQELLRMITLRGENMENHSQNAQTGKFLSIAEFSERIQVPAPTLRRWDANGRLPAHHKSPSGIRYYTEDQVQTYLRTRIDTTGYLTVKAFAGRVGLSTQTIRAYAARGYLMPALTDANGRHYYSEQQVTDYLNGNLARK